MTDTPPTIALRPGEDERDYRAQTLLSLVRLKWFIHLRWVMIGCGLAALAVDSMFSHPARRPLQVYLVLAGLAGINIIWVTLSHYLHRAARDHASGEPVSIRGASALANAQIAVDLLALTLLLRYSGGVESPMAIFYLFHVAIAAILLRAKDVFLHAFWALALYAGMAYGEFVGWISPHYPFLPALPTSQLHEQPAYVCCAVLITGSGIFGMLYFMLRIVARVSSHERMVARANQALRASQQTLTALQARKAEFMRTAAHQLKSPLAAIQTQACLLSEGLVPVADVRPLCDRIIARCREGIEQVADLLTFARLQDLDADRHRGARTDIIQLMRQVCARFMPIAAHKSIQLQCEAPEAGTLPVRVYATDLTDCVVNLIDNAIKYTPPGGQVTARVHAERQQAVVSIADTGMGMSEDTLAHVFEPYRRGTEAVLADIPGSGLGMSIVQAVVEQCGGHLHVDSTPGSGTTITVTFPLASSVPPEAAGSAEKSRPLV